MKKFIYLILFLGIPGIVVGQHIVNQANIDNSKLNIRVGQLENGFRYIIKPIEGDDGKILMRLIVNAGGNEEDADQYELAHLLEHMPHNSTKNFPSLKNNPKFFSELKMQPRDISAFVGGASTQYRFRYPQDVPQALDTALALYYDIAAGNVLFDKNVVHRERKALYQEALYGNMIQSYPATKIQQALTNCKDFIPEPQDLEKTLMNLSIEALKRFYRDWYRPDLMTVSIVGNIKDVDLVESKIRDRFKDLKMPSNPRQRNKCLENYIDSPPHFIVQEGAPKSSKELISQTGFEFHFRNVHNQFKGFSEWQNELLWELLPKMIDHRLKNQQLNYNINYQAFFYTSYDLPAVTLQVKTSDDEKDALEKVFKTLAGISKFGFTTQEWQPVVNEKIKNLQERDYSSSNLWSGLIFKTVTQGKAFPDPNHESEIAFLKSMDAEKINDLIKKEIAWKPDDIAITVPPKADKDQYTQNKIKKWINRGLENPVKYQPVISPDQLVSNEELKDLKKTNILKRNFGNFNEDIIQLENGVRIILKATNPTAGRYKDKIMVHGFSPKGAECLGVKGNDALFAPYIIQNAGVGNYNKFQINKLLAKTSIPFGVNDYIEQRETGIKAEVAPDDIEILMQLIYLSFTNPRYDPQAFGDWKIQELQKSLRNDRPNNNFLDLLNQTLGKVKLPKGGDRYKRSLKVEYQEAFDAYKRLHANAEDFTFIITGDFKKNTMLPILQRYLGNLPSVKNSYVCKEAGKSNSQLKKPAQDVKLTLDKNVDEDFLVIKYITPLGDDPGFKEEIRLEFIKQVLDLKLKELRYNKNLGVYFSVASGSIDYPNKTKEIQLYLRSNREDFDKVLAACHGFFEELKTEPVSSDFLKTIKLSSLFPKWQEPLNRRNKSAMQTLYDFYRFDVPITGEKQAQQFIEEFDEVNLLNTATEYFNNDYKSTFIGSPPEKKEG
ncbi:insulinase family protein [Salegentibacter sp. JZCK2]|uniref:M16 family metallopeptidase n=1 Tax=Salegentibacter tibetensis TaxID=2873600 RepID=UPI001CCC2693|nr:insulinase family protein [Salegentibacter tibetensis]MBZ9730767.1 insulinase family protein [Salegentibacter tibetensis]